MIEPTLTVGDRRVYFRLRHHEPPVMLTGKWGSHMVVATTTCTIERDTEEPIIERSYCSAVDLLAFRWREGRSRAFARAVRKLPRDERAALWHAWLTKTEPRRHLREKKARRRNA